MYVAPWIRLAPPPENFNIRILINFYINQGIVVIFFFFQFLMKKHKFAHLPFKSRMRMNQIYIFHSIA